MPNRTRVIFKKSLLAVAVLSISGCASMSEGPGIGLGDVGNGIVKAGKATADVTRKTWNTTTYLLGFTDSIDGGEATDANEEQLAAAEGDIDQVLPLADPSIADATIADASITEATPADLSMTDTTLPEATLPEATLPEATLPEASLPDATLAGASTIETPLPTMSETELAIAQPTETDRPVILEQATASTAQALSPVETTAAVSEETFMAEKDVTYEVAENETLWDIAKLTTGNANNWHVLADINNLTQSATVFPGQKLTIPSTLVKPDYNMPMASADPAAPAVEVNTQDIDGTVKGALAESTRLAIPSEAGTTPLEQALAATPDDRIDEIAKLTAISQNAQPFDINEGETLWDFAKRTTGDALNWEAIAEQNQFNEKQASTVRPGQTVYVPQPLLDAGLGSVSVTPTPADSEVVKLEMPLTTAASSGESVTPVAVETAAAMPAASDAQIQLTPGTEQLAAAASSLDETQPLTATTSTLDETQPLASATSTLDETQPIEIVEATFKTDENLSPAGTEIEPEPVVENDNIPAEVVVSGTYYPKAVYNNADFSSSLLMRVSPGTSLEVSRALGTWFEVKTEKGVGFVHQRDIK